MGVLQRFERRIEHLVNRPFAKAFRAEVQPVEVASALQRECDNRTAVVGRDRTMVPNAFVVELGQHDHDRLSPYAEPLGAELSDMVSEHAGEQHYTFIGPVSVTFELHDDLDTGMFRVRSSALAGTVPTRSAPAEPEPERTRAFVVMNGNRIELSARETVIGRGLDTDLRVDDPGVSRRHAEIILDGGRSLIRDLGSTNGITVDGRPADRAPLQDGSTIVLGTTTLVFHTGEGA